MFYQVEFSQPMDMFRHESGTDLRFPTHLHESFELIAVTEGEMRITVSERAYTVTKGNAVLVFPNQLHSLDTPQHSCHELWIFSSKHVQAYEKAYSGMVPESNLFSLDPFYFDALMKLNGKENTWKLKGLLYSVCAAFDEGAAYRPISAENNQLLLRIFDFVQKHYTGDCTLEQLSRELGFHYVYLSRYFKERTKIPFTEYVMGHRLTEACYLLKNSQDSILSVSLACGFGSLRSFNRVFREHFGMTPSEYRGKTGAMQIPDK